MRIIHGTTPLLHPLKNLATSWSFIVGKRLLSVIIFSNGQPRTINFPAKHLNFLCQLTAVVAMPETQEDNRNLHCNYKAWPAQKKFFFETSPAILDFGHNLATTVVFLTQKTVARHNVALLRAELKQKFSKQLRECHIFSYRCYITVFVYI
jgi:hypothetical protein